jgi:hypothetical protein
MNEEKAMTKTVGTFLATSYRFRSVFGDPSACRL